MNSQKVNYMRVKGSRSEIPCLFAYFAEWNYLGPKDSPLSFEGAVLNIPKFVTLRDSFYRTLLIFKRTI